MSFSDPRCMEGTLAATGTFNRWKPREMHVSADVAGARAAGLAPAKGLHTAPRVLWLHSGAEKETVLWF